MPAVGRLWPSDDDDDGKDGGHNADKGGGHDAMVDTMIWKMADKTIRKMVDTMITKMANKMIRTMVDKMKRARVAKFLWERVQPRVIREIRLLCSACWVFGGGRGQGLSGRRHLLIWSPFEWLSSYFQKLSVATAILNESLTKTKFMQEAAVISW